MVTYFRICLTHVGAAPLPRNEVGSHSAIRIGLLGDQIIPYG
jgi:hypothetical protein